MVNDKPIQARSNHHIGDMYIHKKYKFIIKIVGRGRWQGDRMVEVLKGTVPNTVKDRVKWHGYTHDLNGDRLNPAMEYSTCALTSCFEKLKSGQVLFG